MRLGAPLFTKYESPDEWVAAVKARGYRAAGCPVGLDASPDLIGSYAAAAEAAGIVIAEVGAWSSPVPLMLEHLPDAEEYEAAAAHIRKVADEVGVPL